MSRARTAEEVVALLSAASEESFYAGLAGIDTESNVSLVVDIVNRLGSAPLPELRRSERLAAVLRKACLSADHLRSVARAASALSPVLANAVAPFLPPSERRRRVGHRSADAEPAAVTSVPAPPPATSPQATAPPETDVCSTVLILSAVAQQDANITLLRDAGFSPFVYDTLEKLTADLASNTDICGCIIDRSFLLTL